MLITLPPPACFMSGYAACEQRKAEVRFVSSTRRHSASVYSWIGLRMFVPALLTRMSRRPKRSRVVLTSRATAASSVTSTLTASAGAPSPSISATARHPEPDPTVATGHDGHPPLEVEHAGLPFAVRITSAV